MLLLLASATPEPLRLAGDIELEISFKNYRQAEILSYLSSVERIDSHSIRYVAKDMVGP